ncbi:L-glutamine ABC transporter membrane protein /L-glutamate ABC transporter membrane protein /L-aspartate ABC transporter membrane protein /L-asparagine ABC transporter membrane protein [Roseovarius pacificus]|uniref:L-glutamine ABC transporter membrane protein /L-glutamate ABC transporter membrane protein /L-aspartate ABC transporter membrane protein /L-asparagine ABC transporter membrane protein n=1 Tax=Roseovarius pacificus TaxID=337701 RepID=A0A1M7GAS4_9RHOB|nr:amino acid ABC transporter permease [Roseovarius pacificus]GGO59849.1 amino acid ABC transporter permease [Roseovarius pacificus]SHM13341.1 L-glutamine ABC transporter membrane protein /L-glutamate ABC transporter membrane protein /L-aspartate ABC transporter membrane protein /L-asparagine ABC transporter membrane protein [Roseovarius pacificus]
MSEHSFVRTEMLPEQAPPATSIGVIGWMRENLFSGWLNSTLTVLSILFIYYVLSGVIPWTFQSVWNAGSLTECREIMNATWGDTHHACWAVIKDRWLQLLYGFYPPYPAYPSATVSTPPPEGWLPSYFRPNLALILLFVALAPVLFGRVPRQLLVVTAAYPFLMPWLLWGGTLWVPVMTAVGFALLFGIAKYGQSTLGALGSIIAAAVVALVWWLFLSGPVAGLFADIIPIRLPVVESRAFGGFMLSILIGVVAIGISLPIGIVLALGRQSDLMIVKTLCVGFIEFIRGVPLITLLFVASVLLNYFMPPGTNFDIIMRVMIMVTLFASAYMAEVIRGGLAALPKGQYEGADSLGLNYWQAQRLIIMPQALKISIPGIVSTFIGVFKDTTLVSIIGLLDPIGLSQSIRANQEWNGIYWELFAFIALLFFICCFGMSRYSMWLERKLQTGHR